MGLASLTMYNGGDAEQAVPKELISSTMYCSCMGLVLSYFALLIQIPRVYARTFLTSETCCDHTCAVFELAKAEVPVSEGGVGNDHYTDVFFINEKIWRKEIGDDVKAWLGEKLSDWIDDAPPWFR